MQATSGLGQAASFVYVHLSYLWLARACQVTILSFFLACLVKHVALKKICWPGVYLLKFLRHPLAVKLPISITRA